MSEDLYEKQRELEYESLVLGRQRYERMLEKRGESDSRPGQEQIRRSVPVVAEALDEYLKSLADGKAVRNATAATILLQVSPEQAAYIAVRHCLDGAARHRSLTSICMDIGKSIEAHLDLVKLADDSPGLYRRVLEQLRNMSATRFKEARIKIVVQKHSVPYNWTDKLRLAAGMKMLELVETSTKLIHTYKQSISRGRQEYRVGLTEDAQAWLGEAHEDAATRAPVHLPMIVPPVDWTTPRKGGYLTKAVRGARMVQVHAPGALDEIANAEMPAVYSAVNRIQSTPWRVNGALLRVMMEAQAAGERFTSLLSEAEVAMPIRPAHIPEGIKADKMDLGVKEDFIVWKQACAAAYAHNGRARSKRVALSQKLWTAQRFAEYDRIWFPHYLDFRGRIYPFCALLNPQSDDVGRSLLEFADGKVLGGRGLYWLKVQTANLFGIDKVSFDERIKWVDDNFDNLLNSAMYPLDPEGSLWTKADSPWCALAACMELAGCMLVGPDNYVSHIPIAMDGSCSGLQHYSAMLRDPVGGASVNLIDADKPGDIYTKVAKAAQAKVDKSTDERAEAWKGGKVVRKIAKQPTMTLCYAATQYGMSSQIQSAIFDLGGEAYLGGADVKGAGTYMASVIWDCLGSVVVAARQGMDFLKKMSDVSTEAQLPIRWTAPNGFPVLQAYRVMLGTQADLHFKGQRIQVKLAVQGSELDRRRQAAGVAPNFVHSMDSAHLMATVNLAYDQDLRDFACIHDSFGVHACDVDVLNVCIREAFIEQYTPNVLARLREEIVEQLEQTSPELIDKLPPVPRMGTLDLEGVRDAKYFFA